MNIIFVRHGKTQNHEDNKRQSPESSLGEVGIDQAQKVAKHLKKKLSEKEYEHIVSSPFKRARETADYIANEVGLLVIENESIHEILSHPNLNNQPLDGEVNAKFRIEVEKYGHDMDWKYDNGGESIREVIVRAKKFKNHLINNYKRKNLVVVSHSTFMRVFFTLILLGEDFEDTTFKNVLETLKIDNTSITEIEYNEEKNLWYIYSVNSTPHLN